MKIIFKIIAKIERHLWSAFIQFFIIKDDPQNFLDNYQSAKETFIKNKPQFNYDKYLTPTWASFARTTEEYFVNSFSFHFLRHQLFKSTMFAHLSKRATKIQKAQIKKQLGEKAEPILKEHSTGSPILNDFEFKTSGNTIHLLYHLTKFGLETGQTIDSTNSVVEFGGGYGNMAKIANKMAPGLTYTIIDIPVFAFVQLVYLKTVLGKEMVTLYDPHQGIVRGKVNIVPIREDTVRALPAALDETTLFISTWALSESNEATQSLVRDLNFFNANYLLLAYQSNNQNFSHAEDIANLTNSYDTVYKEEIGHQPGNYYLFAKHQQ